MQAVFCCLSSSPLRNRPSAVPPSALPSPDLGSAAAGDGGDVAIVLVSNGPGELSTWVQPLVRRLHADLPLRPLVPSAPAALRLVLVPCPNATGTEHQVAERWGLLERITRASQFWPLLLRPGPVLELPASLFSVSWGSS